MTDVARGCPRGRVLEERKSMEQRLKESRGYINKLEFKLCEWLPSAET